MEFLAAKLQNPYVLAGNARVFIVLDSFRIVTSASMPGTRVPVELNVKEREESTGQMPTNDHK